LALEVGSLKRIASEGELSPDGYSGKREARPFRTAGTDSFASFSDSCGATAVDDEVLGRIGPAAVVSEMCGDPDGLDDGVGSDWDAVDLVDDVSQGETKVVGASLVQPESVSVAVDGAIGEIVALGDGADAMPVEKFLLDKLALRVLANGALALVP
jgi:hypothetical protein